MNGHHLYHVRREDSLLMQTRLYEFGPDSPGLYPEGLVDSA